MNELTLEAVLRSAIDAKPTHVVVIAEDSNGSISVGSSEQVTLPVVFLNLERAKRHLLEIYESNLKDHPPDRRG
jgi:hypothetical protein